MDGTFLGDERRVVERGTVCLWLAVVWCVMAWRCVGALIASSRSFRPLRVQVPPYVSPDRSLHDPHTLSLSIRLMWEAAATPLLPYSGRPSSNAMWLCDVQHVNARETRVHSTTSSLDLSHLRRLRHVVLRRALSRKSTTMPIAQHDVAEHGHDHEDNASCWADNHEEIIRLPRRAGFGGVQRAPPG